MAASSKKIFSHLDPEYIEVRDGLGSGKFNGAYYYSKEIVENIIPRVKTTRPWVTVNVPGHCFDHAIVFAHKNTHPERYDWLRDYKDLIIVCSSPLTVKRLSKLGHTVFLPMSVDVEYVKQFKKEKHDLGNCYCGNRWGFKMFDLRAYLPKKCTLFSDMSRDEMLEGMSRYQTVYAVGRCAIEARVLGCKLGVCDSRYPDVNFWKVVDNSEAAKMLQKILNEIDKGETECLHSQKKTKPKKQSSTTTASTTN